MKELSKVYLVGSGPSDASLLTIKARDLIISADVIIYDALVDGSIHRLFPKHAELYDVGKRAGRHALKQEEINALLVEVARTRGGRIIRLKGGDPFVFGRGGEEMQALKEARIPYEVVPGITAGIATPSYWGVPVTQRGLSRSITLATAFTKDGGLPDLDWSAYSRLEGTLVFYMSMRVVPQIAQALLAVGKAGETQAAIMSEGTRPTQRLLQKSLAEFAEIEDYESYSPGLFVVGDVLTFSKEYQWYEAPKLSGKRILITRSEGQTSELTKLLEHHGAEVRVLPTFTIRQEENLNLDLEVYHGKASVLALTSPNAVYSLMKHLRASGRDVRALSVFQQIAVVGPATAQALQEYGIYPDIVAQVHTAEGLAREIAALHPELVFLPTSNLGGAILEEALTQKGVKVDVLCVYHNEPIVYTTEELQSELEQVDWLTFCSSSAVNNFHDMLLRYGLRDRVVGARVAAIGPSTASTLQTLGWQVTAMPERASMPDLVQAILDVQ